MNLNPPHLLCTVAAGVATITFDRPDKLNAFTRAMAVDFIGLLDRLDGEDTVRVIIVTGAGTAFARNSHAANIPSRPPDSRPR